MGSRELTVNQEFFYLHLHSPSENNCLSMTKNFVSSLVDTSSNKQDFTEGKVKGAELCVAFMGGSFLLVFVYAAKRRET